MEINTRDFGIISIKEDSVYSFPQGIYGFEDVDSFAVFMHDEGGVSFVYLQATKSLNPCFLVFSPWDLVHGYAPSVPKEDLAALGAESEQDLVFLTIATVPPKDVRQLTINIKSPVVLNPANKTGRQVILTNEDYPVRHKPFMEAEAAPMSKPAGSDPSASLGKGV